MEQSWSKGERDSQVPAYLLELSLSKGQEML